LKRVEKLGEALKGEETEPFSNTDRS